MSSTRSVGVKAGIVGGALFFLHALIPGSQAYPLLWPALAGAAACWLATRDAASRQLGRGMLAAFLAGCVAGLIGFVGSTATVLLLRRPVLNPAAQALGDHGPSLVLLSAELGLALVAVIAVGAALLGGALMIPVRWLHRPTPDAPAAHER